MLYINGLNIFICIALPGVSLWDRLSMLDDRQIPFIVVVS